MHELPGEALVIDAACLLTAAFHGGLCRIAALLGVRGRQKMKERFEQAAPEIVRTMAIEVAARFGPQAR